MYTAQNFQGKQEVLNHLHLDGSLTKEYLFQFYQNKGEFPRLPERDIFGESIRCSEEDKILDSPEKIAAFQQGVLTKWDITDVFKISIDAMKTANDLMNCAASHCYYLLSQGVKFSEARFAPSYHINSSGDLYNLDEVVEAVLRGFEDGFKETGVKVGTTICIPRENDQEFIKNTFKSKDEKDQRYLFNSIDIVKTAIKYCEKGVIGIDLACYEPIAPAEDFLSAYRLTFDTHVGEMMKNDGANIRNIWSAVPLRLNGIGHAISLAKSQDLRYYVREADIRIESNPRSNLHCGFIKDVKDLELDKLIEMGVKVTINPDDLLWPEAHLADNLALVANPYGMDVVNQCIKNSIETSWVMNETEREEMLRTLQKV